MRIYTTTVTSRGLIATIFLSSLASYVALNAPSTENTEEARPQTVVNAEPQRSVCFDGLPRVTYDGFEEDKKHDPKLAELEKKVYIACAEEKLSEAATYAIEERYFIANNALAMAKNYISKITNEMPESVTKLEKRIKEGMEMKERELPQLPGCCPDRLSKI